jgi:hypothetical protein
VVSSPEIDTNLNTQCNEENKKLIFTGLDIGSTSTSSTNNLQFGSQTPRLDSTILGGGGATSRTIITEAKPDEGEILFISAARRRRRIQKLKPRPTQIP